MEQSRKTIAKAIAYRYNQNENNVQEIAKESPEPYRAIMYTLYPPAERIDGTPEYWEIVRRVEGILNDEPPVEDWND